TPLALPIGDDPVGAVPLQAVRALQRAEERLDKGALVGEERRDAALEQKPNPLAQSGDPEDVRSPPLQAVRKLLGLHRVGRIAAGAPLAPRVYRGALAHRESAGACRSQEGLVPGERQEVDAVLF